MKKIVVIGPESTGKTSLCISLAKHYQSQWCPEYAREYLMKYGNEYSYEDLLTIARGQVDLEDQLSLNFIKTTKPSNNAPFFIDTDQYVMKVWCEFVFDQCHRYILDQIIERKYDLYLLCDTDLPWVKDELREYPDLENRRKLYHIYKDIMINQSVPWVNIHGNYGEREQSAIQSVDNLLNIGASIERK